MPRIIHIKRKIKPSACQATHYNGTRNKSITSSLARKGLKLAPFTALSIIGAVSSISMSSTSSALGKQIYFSVDASNAVIEISLPAANTVMDMVPSSDGTFRTNTLPVTVGTNNANGYQLAMYADNPSLTSTTQIGGKTYTINTLSSNTSSTNFASSTHAASMNKWGYSTNGTTYKPMPSSSSPASVGSYNSNTDGVTSNVIFGVKMNNGIPAATYSTTITFVATANYVSTCNKNSVCYVGNGGAGGMDVQTASGTTTTLWASNYQRAGYGFAGWNTKSDGTGINYGPNEDIATSLTSGAEGLTLYANWVASAGNLQGWTDCSSLASGAVTALTDTRDNNVYAVAKLADGKCWMIENLRLNNTGSSLSSSNTNVASNWATNGGMVMDATTGTKSTRLNAPSISEDYWCVTEDNAACYDQSRLATQNVSDSIGFMSASEPTNGAVNNATKTGASDNNIYSYGNYYNWYSATAGSGTQSVSSTKNTDVSYSLCPTSWRLPKGGASDRTNVATTSEFWKLGLSIMGKAPNIANSSYSYYDSSSATQAASGSFAGKTMTGLTATKAFRTYPNNFLFSGSQAGADTNNRGTNGHYWSSTANATKNAFLLRLRASDVSPGSNANYKYYGFSVRCVIGS